MSQAQPLIIDCHGHYTTAPKALEEWRNRQIAGIQDAAARPRVAARAVLLSSCCYVLARMTRSEMRAGNPLLLRSSAGVIHASAASRLQFSTGKMFSPPMVRFRLPVSAWP